MRVKRLVVGSSFVCHTDGIGAQFYLMDDQRVQVTLVLSERQQGPPGFAHGGALAALVDEAMGAAAWAAGHPVVAVNLNFSYKHPVPLGTEIRAVGSIARVDGRKVFTVGSVILPDETLAVEATGVFVTAPQLFEKAGFIFVEEP